VRLRIVNSKLLTAGVLVWLTAASNLLAQMPGSHCILGVDLGDKFAVATAGVVTAQSTANKLVAIRYHYHDGFYSQELSIEGTKVKVGQRRHMDFKVSPLKSCVLSEKDGTFAIAGQSTEDEKICFQVFSKEGSSIKKVSLVSEWDSIKSIANGYADGVGISILKNTSSIYSREIACVALSKGTIVGGELPQEFTSDSIVSISAGKCLMGRWVKSNTGGRNLEVSTYNIKVDKEITFSLESKTEFEINESKPVMLRDLQVSHDGSYIACSYAVEESDVEFDGRIRIWDPKVDSPLLVHEIQLDNVDATRGMPIAWSQSNELYFFWLKEYEDIFDDRSLLESFNAKTGKRVVISEKFRSQQPVMVREYKINCLGSAHPIATWQQIPMHQY
jgi:hypothetical protein